jgi:hypothetical protein
MLSSYDKFATEHHYVVTSSTPEIRTINERIKNILCWTFYAHAYDGILVQFTLLSSQDTFNNRD